MARLPGINISKGKITGKSREAPYPIFSVIFIIQDLVRKSKYIENIYYVVNVS